ncbi:MAG TPA: TIGR03089 family protein [Mycobacteriales bacterium]|nr:TIGR03089 family protein [Mycobacteriales bacterium]
MSVTDTLLRAALDRDPARPLLTYYDDATGERTELSATTLDNWVAKTANLARDDLGVRPGDRMAVLLPAHWQTAAVLLAVWAVGGVACDDPAGAAATFCDADRIGLAGGEVVALSLAPLGRGLATVPPGVIDYAVDVRGHGDRFAPFTPVGGDTPALDCGGTVRSTAAVVARAAERAGEFGLRTGDRVLSTLDWTGPADWLDGWLAPLSAGASLVQCTRPADPGALARRAAAERVTATIGTTLPELRTLSR